MDSSSALPQDLARQKLVVLHDTQLKAIHFTSSKLQGKNLWIPYSCDFSDIEKIMVLNKVAVNVAHINVLRTCGQCTELEVVYNAA